MATYDYVASDPAPYAINRRLVANTRVLPSVFTRKPQVIARPGSYWAMDVTWRNLSGANLLEVVSFFRRLNGQEHQVQFHAHDYDWKRGAWSGTPVVDGGGQTGTSIDIRGATATVTNWARAGDLFYYGAAAELKQVMADADSDGSGNVTLAIGPDIHISPADGAAVNHAATWMPGLFLLMTDVETAFDAARHNSVDSYFSDLSLSFREFW